MKIRYTFDCGKCDHKDLCKFKNQMFYNANIESILSIDIATKGTPKRRILTNDTIAAKQAELREFQYDTRWLTEPDEPFTFTIQCHRYTVNCNKK